MGRGGNRDPAHPRVNVVFQGYISPSNVINNALTRFFKGCINWTWLNKTIPIHYSFTRVPQYYDKKKKNEDH
jgi:hypothetical protein